MLTSVIEMVIIMIAQTHPTQNINIKLGKIVLSLMNFSLYFITLENHIVDNNLPRRFTRETVLSAVNLPAGYICSLDQAQESSVQVGRHLVLMLNPKNEQNIFHSLVREVWRGGENKKVWNPDFFFSLNNSLGEH